MTADSPSGIPAFLRIEPAMMQLLSADQAWHYRILPKEATDEAWVLYADGQHAGALVREELEMLTGKSVRLVPTDAALIEDALKLYFPKASAPFTPDKARVSTPGSQHPEVAGEAFLWQLIREAKGLRSSDIHLESYQERCRVRIRIDGMLVERYALTRAEYPALVNQIKILANLDIAEKRLPQDGRIYYVRGEDQFDIRVSVLPTLHGEKVVMRLLSQDATRIDINRLGFHPLDLTRYLEGIRRPTGIMLISGPTGSGKTTTLYATLKLLNNESRNILTIEDPIEYTLEGINQVQLKEGIGLGFPVALRTFLRQDPNVIMVGEIRDVDTANMAIRAALTGHLVLSTIHTNSAWGTVSRLVDMGIPPFLLAGTLHTTVAQRLVRLLCPHCKRQQTLPADSYPPSFQPASPVTQHWLPQGCPQCHQTGYQGRRAIYEVISIDRALATCIKENQMDVASLLEDRGVKSLASNAFAMFETGETSLEEIYPLLVQF